jgi:galactokinase
VPSQVSAFAPGRVNLIGEHTDYNDGFALPFAIEAGVTVRASALPGRRVEAVAVDLGGTDAFDLSGFDRGDGWRSFVRGAVGELQRAGVEVPGAALEINGSVPRGAGLSSSAALEVALVLDLLGLAGVPPGDRTELARLCSRIENEWVGARTGLLDQLASLYGESGRALRIDFRSLEVRAVPLDLQGHRLVVLDSGEEHSNASSGYNERRAECARACELLGISSLRDATLDLTERLPEPLNRRARHVLTSNRRVDEFVAALAAHDFPRMGALLDESHASLRDDYEVSTPTVERAVRRLKAAGALGARIHGGGFGGGVLGLFPPDATPPEGSIEVAPGAGARLTSGNGRSEFA